MQAIDLYVLFTGMGTMEMAAAYTNCRNPKGKWNVAVRRTAFKTDFIPIAAKRSILRPLHQPLHVGFIHRRSAGTVTHHCYVHMNSGLSAIFNYFNPLSCNCLCREKFFCLFDNFLLIFQQDISLHSWQFYQEEFLPYRRPMHLPYQCNSS